VHVANRIEQDRPLRSTDVLAQRAPVANLRPPPKGTQVDAITETGVAGEAVCRDPRTHLRRREPSAEPQQRRSGAPRRPIAQWRVPGDTGRRYAAVSGDRNPIHLRPLTAKAFGFPRAIAHGMWSKARCLAALSHRLPGACAVEVEFRK